LESPSRPRTGVPSTAVPTPGVLTTRSPRSAGTASVHRLSYDLLLGDQEVDELLTARWRASIWPPRPCVHCILGSPPLSLHWDSTGTRVGLYPEPVTDRVDQYGRLLRYVVRVRDGLNLNVQLVRVGAAAPYFYQGRRGRYAALLERLALRAKAKKLGMWGLCPHTSYDPKKGVSTRR
jgi:hypothetical protein